MRIVDRVHEYVQLAGKGAEFRMPELLGYVRRRFPHSAPASVDRLLRQLRLDGKVDYTVVNRRQSLYRVDATG